jgi:hypothetical protein
VDFVFVFGCNLDGDVGFGLKRALRCLRVSVWVWFVGVGLSFAFEFAKHL